MLCKSLFFGVAFLFCVAGYSFAQQFSGTPANIHWRQLNTDTLKIIYPSGLDSIARHIATITQQEQKKYAGTIGHTVHKINIVLRNELTYFNGYVSLGPYRSEFYLLPQQNAFDLGAQSAADLLAVHEYRHVEQYSNFRKGLSKTAYYLFGQNGQALANNAAVPNWFFEGDAVYNETELSRQGRGRLPNFFSGYEALFLAHKQYSFMKLRNGSFKDYIPDHYPLGYMLVAYGKEKYGEDIWRKVTGDAVRFKPLLYPWQGAIKKYTGIPYRQFVQQAFDYYHNQWQQAIPAVNWLTPVKNNRINNYQYPYLSASNSVIILKKSAAAIPAFYTIAADGSQTRIAAQSITNDDYFSYNNGIIIYAVYQADARWGYREYNNLAILNTATGKEKKLTTHTRYFSPDISHNGKLIAAVAVLPSQQSTLDVLDRSGNKLIAFTNNDNEIYSYPKFTADDRSLLVMLRKTTGEMSLQQIDMQSNNITVVLPFANRILGYPSIQGDTLLYSCTGNGSDEIHAYVLSQKKQYRLAMYPTGLYGAVLRSDQKLVSTALTADGNRTGIFTPLWQPVSDLDTLKYLYVSLPTAASITSPQPAGQRVVYPVTKYHTLANPFNFHSWQPDYSDPLFSFTVYGENILNTFQSQLYYIYNTVEKYQEAGADFTYGGWYVQPFLSVAETFSRKGISSTNDLITWNEWNGGAGLKLPLNFSGGKQYRYLTTSASYNIRGRQFTGMSKAAYSNDTYNTIESRLSYTGQQQQAVQQIYPHWAQTLLVQYRTLASSKKAYQLLLSGSLYLPGFTASHSLVLSAAYQTADTLANYRFSNNFPFSRGYDLIEDRVYPNTIKLGINYHFPIVYPDWGIGNIVYLRRVRANLFFDYTQLRTNNVELYKPAYDFKSAGAEIYADTRWWNQQNITVGIRYSRLLDTKYTGRQPNRWTVILPQSIFY